MCEQCNTGEAIQHGQEAEAAQQTRFQQGVNAVSLAVMRETTVFSSTVETSALACGGCGVCGGCRLVFGGALALRGVNFLKSIPDRVRQRFVNGEPVAELPADG